MKQIPSILVGLRFVIAFVLLWDASDHVTGKLFWILFLVAFLSDVFDGIIARRLGVATSNLRIWDGYADITLYVCIVTSLFWVHGDWIGNYKIQLVFLIALQIFSWAFSLLKFGKITSYHSYFAKLWGLTLCIATLGIFALGWKWIIWLPLVAGFVSLFEDIVITSILRTWKNDVLTIKQAFEIRRGSLISD